MDFWRAEINLLCDILTHPTSVVPQNNPSTLPFKKEQNISIEHFSLLLGVQLHKCYNINSKYLVAYSNTSNELLMAR